LGEEQRAADLIGDFVTALSPEYASRLARLLRSHGSFSEVTGARIMREIPNDGARERIAGLIAVLSTCPGISPEIAAFGIECALNAAHDEATAQTVDVVWTGPESSDVSVRRSAAVLLQLIEGAEADLIIMSFASFRIPDVEAALRSAADRGVQLHLIMESTEESSGRYRGFGASAFGALGHKGNVSYYCWPREKRPGGALLHAKAVIADGRSALITSANLTERAIDSNIELGLLIHSESVSKRLRGHILSLIASGEFQEVTVLP
jgi:phosphatidylserine/phosphatidylglycerophosphate/cardiolipin synthase-like enzyme